MRTPEELRQRRERVWLFVAAVASGLFVGLVSGAPFWMGRAVACWGHAL